MKEDQLEAVCCAKEVSEGGDLLGKKISLAVVSRKYLSLQESIFQKLRRRTSPKIKAKIHTGRCHCG